MSQPGLSFPGVVGQAARELRTGYGDLGRVSGEQSTVLSLPCGHLATVDWSTAYRFFSWGVTLFLCDLSLLGWVQFSSSVMTSCKHALPPHL